MDSGTNGSERTESDPEIHGRGGSDTNGSHSQRTESEPEIQEGGESETNGSEETESDPEIRDRGGSDTNESQKMESEPENQERGESETDGSQRMETETETEPEPEAEPEIQEGGETETNTSDEIEIQSEPEFEIPPYLGKDEHRNLITTTHTLAVELTLRHIVSQRFANGMPEDCIAVILREILEGLSYIHNTHKLDYNGLHAGQICVSNEGSSISIRIIADPYKNYVNPAAAASTSRQPRIPTEGIRGVGMIALELAYGSLPRNCTTPQHFDSLANNLIKILKLKLGIGDDQQGEEDTSERGREIRQLIIQMPELEKLLDDDYVESLKKKLEEKPSEMEVPQRTILRTGDGGDERQFSSNFLEVVLKCLDAQNPTPAEDILAHPFLEKPLSLELFEFIMRSPP